MSDEATEKMTYDGKTLLQHYRKGYEDGYREGRADAIDEMYNVALNEAHNIDDVIEWLQDNLIDKGAEQ